MYNALIDEINNFPSKLELITSKIDPTKLDNIIREGAWTVRQSVNHIADSLVNSYIRLKFTLTEDNPTIMAYNEEKWAEITDTKEMGIDSSLLVIRGLHERIVFLLENLSDEDWKRHLTHSEAGEMTFLDYVKVVADHGPKHMNSVIKALDM